MTIYLSKDELLDIHEKVQKKYNSDGGVLNNGLLETLVDIPSRKIFGNEIFPTIFEKAAAMLVNITKLHAFVDCNKRTAILAVETFLQSNGIDVIIPLKTTRFSVIIAASQIELVRTLIERSTIFISNYSLDKNDVKGSIRSMSWMINEINEFVELPQELKLSLLKYWLVYETYPEYEEKGEEIINEYISNLYTTITIFIEKIKNDSNTILNNNHDQTI